MKHKKHIQRQHAVSFYRKTFSDEAFVTIMIGLYHHAKKSRKRKEYLRAIIRTTRQDTDGRHYLYFLGQIAVDILNKQETQTKREPSPDGFTFVDLGLPSGRQWATKNAPGHYTFDEACEAFGEHLPKKSAMAELIEECKCSWNKEKRGLDVVGPNGNSIFLPAAGCVYPHENEPFFVDIKGEYWTQTLYSQKLASHLFFNPVGLHPMGIDDRRLGCSVRLCKEPH